MSYSNENNPEMGFLYKLKNKFGKFLTKSFPLNSVRVFGLKLCGFNLGKQIYIGQDLILASPVSENTCKLIIEDRVAIGPRVTLVLSSDANWSKLMETIKPVKGSITLEHDCWIGAGAIILPNVIVGAFSIVGAGAVVTRSVPPNTIVAGVPAREIKRIISDKQ